MALVSDDIMERAQVKCCGGIPLLAGIRSGLPCRVTPPPSQPSLYSARAPGVAPVSPKTSWKPSSVPLKVLKSHNKPGVPGLPKRANQHLTSAQAVPGHLTPAADPVVEIALSILYPERRKEETAAYVEMARLFNLIPSCILVFLGAWVGAGRSLGALVLGKTWLVSAISGSIAVGSCVLNDFFDYAVDSINDPNKPLPRGSVPLDGALLLSFFLYSCVLISTCILEPPALRIIIAASAAATLLYTPLLKRVTLVKNVAVAAVIALSPVSGALAAGAGGTTLRAVAVPATYLFLLIMHRELLMDINDTKGDGEMGVNTIPVVFGRDAALMAAAALCVAASAIALQAAAAASLWAVAPSFQSYVRRLLWVLSLVTTVPLLAAIRKVYRSRYDRAVVKDAVEGSMKYIGMGLLLMACLV